MQLTRVQLSNPVDQVLERVAIGNVETNDDACGEWRFENDHQYKRQKVKGKLLGSFEEKI
jgi:hypothetical protein